MIPEEQILEKLDNYKFGPYCQFINLDAPYSYLIDCRLNIFSNNNDKWAIAAERLGYNPRQGSIEISIHYFGNCLINLEHYNNYDVNYYSVMPIDMDSFCTTVDGEALKTDAKYWNIRDRQIEINQNPKDYLEAGIELRENYTGGISIEAVGRFLALKNKQLLRASDQELYKSIPENLKKILVIDEWYHQDFTEVIHPGIVPAMSEEQLRAVFEFNKNLGAGDFPLDFESFSALFRNQEESNSDFNQKQWEDNRPGSYETWQLIAKVISTGDISYYKPTLTANTHWKNWSESGSL
jgi:hypothetical protein